MSDQPRAPTAGEQSGSIVGLAKVAASAWWNTTGWALGTSVRAGTRLLRAATSPASALELAGEVRDLARGYASDLVGGDVEEAVRNAMPDRFESMLPKTEAGADPRANGDAAAQSAAARSALQGSLSVLGAELMRKSADVRYVEDAHPAYERILGEMAPDEGRILRLLLVQGPQPAVDVRTGGPVSMFTSDLIAPGLSMIGKHAACRYQDRVPSYLNNLFRLGLIWFSREMVTDLLRYQVLEAQPDVLGAMHSVKRHKVVRRSIHLTPFGEDFCRNCLPLPPTQLAALPEHLAPEEI
jgi:hypothetical protein